MKTKKSIGKNTKKMKLKLEVGVNGLVNVTCLSKPYKGNVRVCDKKFSRSLMNLMSDFDGTWWIGERG